MSKVDGSCFIGIILALTASLVIVGCSKKPKAVIVVPDPPKQEVVRDKDGNVIAVISEPDPSEDWVLSDHGHYICLLLRDFERWQLGFDNRLYLDDLWIIINNNRENYSNLRNPVFVHIGAADITPILTREDKREIRKMAELCQYELREDLTKKKLKELMKAYKKEK